MAKYISIYKISQKIYHTIQYNTLYNINYFLIISEIKAILKPNKKNNYKTYILLKNILIIIIKI